MFCNFKRATDFLMSSFQTVNKPLRKVARDRVQAFGFIENRSSAGWFNGNHLYSVTSVRNDTKKWVSISVNIVTKSHSSRWWMQKGNQNWKIKPLNETHNYIKQESNDTHLHLSPQQQLETDLPLMSVFLPFLGCK